MSNGRMKTELKENNYDGKRSLNELYHSYLTVEDLKKHPEITPAVKGDKKIKLDVLSVVKPKVINMGGLNSNRIKFANSLNSFHNIFFNYNKNQKNSLGEIRTLRKENKEFMQKFKDSKKDDNKEDFKEIREEYKKRNYYVPQLDEKKNIFNGNILLSNKEDLKKYIIYDLGNNLSNKKSLSFLHKINRKLGDKTSEKPLKLINEALNIGSFSRDKIEKDKIREIRKFKNEISNVQDTLNSMDEIDYFFDINNKQYLDELKNQESRENSEKLSTRVNSTLNFENIKYQKNIKISNNELENQIKQKQKSTNNLLFDYRNKKKGTNISRISKISNDESENIYNNKKNNYRYGRNNTKAFEREIFKSTLEKLYDRISKKDNLLNYQHEITDYLKNKKADISVRINPSTMCNNFEKTREKICQSEYLKNDINLRKKMDGPDYNIDKIKSNDLKTKHKVNHIEDVIIKLYNDIDNLRKDSE